MNSSLNILVCVLNWGLGHASRMVPLIDTLKKEGIIVVLASSGLAGVFLKQRYPSMKYYELEDYQIRYSKGNWMSLAMLRSTPALFAAIKMEQRQVKEIVRKEPIDAIISDNRYGCHLPSVPSMLVTHQVQPLAPRGMSFLQPLINKGIRNWIHRFDECWIPDFSNHGISGRLSEVANLKIPVLFLGLLSRFKEIPEVPSLKYDWLAILSGPEPQRSMLQERFVAACNEYGKTGVVLAGIPGATETMEKGISIIPHLPDDRFLKLIAESKYVLMRPGYSSLMDFIQLGKPALVIPTPGQTEQQYLAGQACTTRQFVVQQQSTIDLDAAEKALEGTMATSQFQRADLLARAISHLSV